MVGRCCDSGKRYLLTPKENCLFGMMVVVVLIRDRVYMFQMSRPDSFLNPYHSLFPQPTNWTDTSSCLVSPWEPLYCSFTRYISPSRVPMKLVGMHEFNDKKRKLALCALPTLSWRNIYQSVTSPYCIYELDVAWTYSASQPWEVITSWNCQEVSSVLLSVLASTTRTKTTTNKRFNSKRGKILLERW